MQKNIPLRVKCTFSDAPGTLVTHERPYQSIDITRDRTITGITHIQDITRLRISTKDAPDIPDFQRRVFKALALAGISVDFINVGPEAILFTINNSVVSKALQVLDNMDIRPEVFSRLRQSGGSGSGYDRRAWCHGQNCGVIGSGKSADFTVCRFLYNDLGPC
jgi:aspartate kinase